MATVFISLVILKCGYPHFSLGIVPSGLMKQNPIDINRHKSNISVKHYFFINVEDFMKGI